MVGVTINSGSPEPQDPCEKWPKERWGRLVRERCYFGASQLPFDGRCLKLFAEDAEKMWETLGYESADHLIRVGYELDPSFITAAVAVLQTLDTKEPVKLEDVEKLAKQGRPGKANNISFIKGKGFHGTSFKYIQRRLQRDRPDLLKRVIDGEMSAHAAALEAGFRKPHWQCEATSAGVCKLIDKLDGDGLSEVFEYVDALRSVGAV